MSKEQVRPVRLHVAMEEKNPLRRAIERVFGVIGDEKSHCFVQKISEADLVVFSEMQAIEAGFSTSRTYAFIGGMTDKKPNLPSNVTTLPVLSLVADLAKLISEVSLKLEPLVEEKVPTQEKIGLRPDALRVLVIDDTAEHLASAKSGLAGYCLTTTDGYETAMDILGNEKFDVVLTDLHLPMSSKTLGSQAFKLGELVPYGILLMVEAARRGAKFVAVVTDLNHHADPFSAAFDHFSHFSVKIENAKVLMMHAPMKGSAKDWASALDQLLKE